MVYQQTTDKIDMPVAILSDNGSRFVGMDDHKKPAVAYTPTLLENKLLDPSTELINSRPHRPQTKVELERFPKSLEGEIQHHPSLDYIECYNTEHPLFSSDINSRRMSLTRSSSMKPESWHIHNGVDGVGTATNSKCEDASWPAEKKN